MAEGDDPIRRPQGPGGELRPAWSIDELPTGIMPWHWLTTGGLHGQWFRLWLVIVLAVGSIVLGMWLLD